MYVHHTIFGLGRFVGLLAGPGRKTIVNYPGTGKIVTEPDRHRLVPDQEKAAALYAANAPMGRKVLLEELV